MFDMIDSFFDFLNFALAFVAGLICGAVAFGAYLVANDFIKSTNEEPFPDTAGYQLIKAHRMAKDEMTEHVDEALAIANS